MIREIIPSGSAQHNEVYILHQADSFKFDLKISPYVSGVKSAIDTETSNSCSLLTLRNTSWKARFFLTEQTTTVIGIFHDYGTLEGGKLQFLPEMNCNYRRFTCTGHPVTIICSPTTETSGLTPSHPHI